MFYDNCINAGEILSYFISSQHYEVDYEIFLIRFLVHFFNLTFTSI